MQIVQIISRWNKPGSRYEKDSRDGGMRKRVNGESNMAQCIVRLNNGQLVTRHIPIGRE